MARANRHYIPGHIWHITHRCHRREFLLKFSKDRARWLQWLVEARKRYGLVVLNYTVTSNQEEFIEETKKKLGIQAIGRMVIQSNGHFELKDPGVSYNAHFGPKKANIDLHNGYFGDVS